MEVNTDNCDLRDMSLRWQVKRCLEDTRIFLVSNIPEEDALKTGFTALFRTFDEALGKAFEDKGKNATVNVIDRAGRPTYVLPT